jgi:predicted acetyltransferase
MDRKLEFIKINEKQKAYLMLLDYLKELSEFDDSIEFDKNGDAIDKWFDYYWVETDERFPFWFYVNNKIAGFSFIRFQDNGITEVAEYYVLPKFRKDGNAIFFMDTLYKMFDGPWDISTQIKNTRAVKFWKKFCYKHKIIKEVKDEKHITWIIE